MRKILFLFMLVFVLSLPTSTYAGAGSEGYCIIPPTVQAKLGNVDLVEVTTQMRATHEEGKLMVITTYTFSDGSARAFQEVVTIDNMSEAFKSHFGAEHIMPNRLMQMRNGGKAMHRTR